MEYFAVITVNTQGIFPADSFLVEHLCMWEQVKEWEGWHLKKIAEQQRKLLPAIKLIAKHGI